MIFYTLNFVRDITLKQQGNFVGIYISLGRSAVQNNRNRNYPYVYMLRMLISMKLTGNVFYVIDFVLHINNVIVFYISVFTRINNLDKLG